MASDRGPLVLAALGSGWHRDPDGDGIASSGDRCPNVYDPEQSDGDGDGVGDACDEDAAPKDAGLVIRVEHVTPYGGWLSLVATGEGRPSRLAGVAWSQEADALATSEGVASALANGAAETFPVVANLQDPQGPIIVTSMEPGTAYYAAAFYRNRDNQVLGVGPTVKLETQPEPSLKLSRPHPRISLSADDIAAFRARYADGDKVWGALEERMGELALRAARPGRRVYQPRSYCATAALLYQVTQKLAYRDAAAALLARAIESFEKTQLRGDGYTSTGSSLAVCLDLLGKEVDSPTRARVVAAYIDDDERNLESSPRLERTGGFATSLDVLLVNSLAACGADDLPDKLRDKGCAHLEVAKRRWFGIQLVKARRDRGRYAQSGGYLPEGVDGAQLTARSWARSFIAMSNAGMDIGEYREFLRNLLIAQWMHSLTPGLKGFATIGSVANFARRERDGRRRDEAPSSDGPWLGEPNSAPFEHLQVATLATLVGALDRASMADEAAWARWLIARYTSDYNASNLANLLYEHGGIARRDPRVDLPLAYLDSGFGALFSRTSWRDNASFLLLRAGFTGVEHTHGDAGHFQLYRRGRWITHEVLGRGGAAVQADAHNVLALEGRSRGNLRVGQYIGDAGSIRGILRASNHTGHTFAVADTTGAYRSSRTRVSAYDRVQRSLLWLHGDESDSPDIVVIYDQAEPGRASERRAQRRERRPSPEGRAGQLPPRLLFHFDERPAISGQRATVQLPGEPDQRAELYALHPKAASLSALPAEGKPGQYPPKLYTHRVAIDMPVSPTPATLRAITILRASNASSEPGPAPRAIATDDFMGAAIGADVVLFPAAAVASDASAQASASASASFSSSGEGVSRVWWSGFAPGARLRITARQSGNTVKLSAKQGGDIRADDAGLVAVTIDASGAISKTYGK